MQSNKNNSAIETDKALVDIKQDALGVAGLAERIALSILYRTSSEGLVIGLYGAWGSGKTTFINFVEQVLKKAPEKEQPVILRFNPWLFSGHEDLIQRYLIELSKALDPENFKSLEKRKKFVEGVENFAGISEQLLLFAAGLHANPFFAGGIKALGGLSKRAIKQLKAQESLSTQKAKIELLLKESKRKILVIIDDIDRLDPKEVPDIFRMVKAAVDFPNVIYLLSFDKKLVAKIIKGQLQSDGNEYLEKIIQYEIDLPPATPQGVLKLFGERVDPVIEADGGKSWDKDRWSEFYRDYLRVKMRMPRQAIRLSNSFNLAYPSLRGEVDPVDFLAIETLRMFNSEIYQEIRLNSEKYTELGQNQIDTEKKDVPYFNKVLEAVPESDRDSVKSLLGFLFPRVENAFSKFKMSSDTRISEWRAQSRICSSVHFGRYFSYSIASDQFSDAEIKNAITLISDRQKFEDLLLDYSKPIVNTDKSRIPDFLERLLDSVKAGQADSHLEEIVQTFLILGDKIVRKEDEDRSFMRIGTDLRVMWLILAAMERLPKASIPTILKVSFEQTESLHTPLRLLYHLGREQGKYADKGAELIRDNREPYLSIDQIDELAKIILAKASVAAKKGTLFDDPMLHSTLYRWKDISGNFDEQREWVKKITAPDEGFKKFITKLTSVTVTSNMKGTTERIAVHSESVGNFLDLDAAYRRAKTLFGDQRNDSLTQTALKAFIDSCEEKRNFAG